jgi:hypothetical protein
MPVPNEVAVSRAAILEIQLTTRFHLTVPYQLDPLMAKACRPGFDEYRAVLANRRVSGGFLKRALSEDIGSALKGGVKLWRRSHVRVRSGL